MTTEGSVSHVEESRDQVIEAESVGSKAVMSGEPSSSANHQKAETFHPESEDEGRPGKEASADNALKGMGDDEGNTLGKAETTDASSLWTFDRLASIIGEFKHVESGEAAAAVPEGDAASSGELLASAGREPVAAFGADSGDDEIVAERPAQGPSSLWAGLSHVQLNQVEKLVGLYQSEWQARSQQDQLNRDLVMRAERQKAELDLQKQKFAAEQEKLEADLEHQQELARLEARKESTGELIRSVVLLLVVLAVVLTPLLAMGWLKVPPQSFSQYVAPITGITGTVLGYWFGRQDPRK